MRLTWEQRDALTARLRLGLSASIWRDALLAWLAQRVFFVGLVALWVLVLPPSAIATGPGHVHYTFVQLWSLWDGIFYVDIAAVGYRVLPQAAFYPLYPLLEHLLAPVVGGSYALAGLLIANAADFGALVLLRWLAEEQFGERVARRTLVSYVCFPTSIFFLAGYTESLFLLLSVAMFLALRRRRWLLVALLCALATLTRSTGLALLAPVAVTALGDLRQRAGSWRAVELLRAWRVLLAPALVCLVAMAAFAGLQLYLNAIFGPNALMRAQDEPAWRRSLDWPWAGTVSDVHALLTGGPNGPITEVVKNLVFLTLWLGLALSMLWLVRRGKMPVADAAYTWACLLQVLIVPARVIPGTGLLSISRFLVVVFPCFILLARLGLRWKRVRVYGLALSLAYSLVATLSFASVRFFA